MSPRLSLSPSLFPTDKVGRSEEQKDNDSQKYLTYSFSSSSRTSMSAYLFRLLNKRCSFLFLLCVMTKFSLLLLQYFSLLPERKWISCDIFLLFVPVYQPLISFCALFCLLSPFLCHFRFIINEKCILGLLLHCFRFLSLSPSLLHYTSYNWCAFVRIGSESLFYPKSMLYCCLCFLSVSEECCGWCTSHILMLICHSWSHILDSSIHSIQTQMVYRTSKCSHSFFVWRMY